MCSSDLDLHARAKPHLLGALNGRRAEVDLDGEASGGRIERREELSTQAEAQRPPVLLADQPVATNTGMTSTPVSSSV